MRHLFQRACATLCTVLLVSVAAFGLTSLAPVDPARMALAASRTDIPDADEVAAKRAALGLDQPLHTRYWLWLANAARGDFGASFRTGQPVLNMYRERIGATLLLASVAIALTVLVGIPLGVAAATTQHRGARALTSAGTALLVTVPAFVSGMALIYVFAVQLRWLPALGSPTARGLVLPALILAAPNIAVIARITHANVLEALSKPFMIAARAKGLGRIASIWRHVLPATATSTLAALGLEAAYLLTGTVVVETVFAYPGVGRMASEAALIGDVPVLALLLMIAGLIYGVCGMLTDIAISVIDPRVRAL
jgi:peptide/nickel transport system permease protein